MGQRAFRPASWIALSNKRKDGRPITVQKDRRELMQRGEKKCAPPTPHSPSLPQRIQAQIKASLSSNNRKYSKIQGVSLVLGRHQPPIFHYITLKGSILGIVSQEATVKGSFHKMHPVFPYLGKFRDLIICYMYQLFCSYNVFNSSKATASSRVRGLISA